MITLFAPFYVLVGILLPCGKHLHNRRISLRGWGGGRSAHRTSLTPPLVIDVPVSRPGKWVDMYLCVRGIDVDMYLCVRGIDVDMYLCVRGHVFVC